METLKKCLDQWLKYANEASYENVGTYISQAFGMINLFVALYPSLEAEAVALWEEVYRPAFYEIYLK